MEHLRKEFDFWEEARLFMQSQLPSDFQDKLQIYASEKGLNENEFRLFVKMLESSISFDGTVVILKHYN